MQRRIRHYLTLILASVLLVLCGCEPRADTEQEGLPQMTETECQKWLSHTADENSQIVLGDILFIYHEEASDINSVHYVDPGIAPTAIPGAIRPNGLEYVVVVAKTPQQVKEQLENLYEEQQEEDQRREIVLQVKNLRECILITGEITTPGLYALTESKSLEQVIQEAGEFTDYADKTDISVFRKVGAAVERTRLDFQRKEEASKSFEIQPGDRITVMRIIDYSTN